MASNGVGPRAHDLRSLKITATEAQQAQEMLELQAGKRCGGCGRRIGIGIKFTSLDVRSGQPILQKSACDREGCEWAELCRDGATFMEVFECVWVDANGLDAPASELVKQRTVAPAADEEPAPPRSNRAAEI